jgi:hypothetical protein
MKKILFAILALALTGSSALAQQLSDADREKGVEYLEQTRDGVVDAVKGLSDAQMNFKSGPERWSVAQVLEHIALAEDMIFANVTNNVMKAGPGPADRDVEKIDAAVLMMVPDRSHPAQAPPPLVPTGKWTAEQALQHFLASREKTIAYLKATPDLRAHATDSPMGQPLDAYEWLLFIGAHSARHTKQILEVKADPNFPKN